MDEENATPDAQPPYRPLRFLPTRHNASLARESASEWLNYYGKVSRSISQWRKLDPINFRWQTPDMQTHSVTFRFDRLVENIIQDVGFVPEHLGIPPNVLTTPWADRSIQFSMNHIWINPEDKTKTYSTIIQGDMGEGFPLKVAIDREGFSFAPLHAFLYKGLLYARNQLVNESEKMFHFNDGWLQSFFSYFNSCISIVESTLVQIYYKAKYEPDEAGLTFDVEKMGTTITGRVTEKFDWIRYATGQPLDGAGKELAAFKRLKSIRNHINHFDPPIFGCTTEDLCGWLNLTSQIGSLLWKVRRRLKLPPSKAILSLMFAPEVEFVPSNLNIKRVLQPDSVGYASCIWKTDLE